MFFIKKNKTDKIEKKTIPCKKSKVCLYGYSMTDRDIEGMPFPKKRGDKRACPKYGHICPEFMEDSNLTVEDLKIRSTIHCGFTAKMMIERGEWDLDKMDPDQVDQIKSLLIRFEDRLQNYSPEEYPKYYDF